MIHQGLLLNAICLLVLYFYSLSLSLCSLTLFFSRLFILKLKNLSNNNYVHVFILLPLDIIPPLLLIPLLLLLFLYRMSRNKQSIDVSSLPKIATALLEPGERFSPSPSLFLISLKGKKSGDTKLVNNNGVPEVYQV